MVFWSLCRSLPNLNPEDLLCKLYVLMLEIEYLQMAKSDIPNIVLREWYISEGKLDVLTETFASPSCRLQIICHLCGVPLGFPPVNVLIAIRCFTDLVAFWITLDFQPTCGACTCLVSGSTCQTDSADPTADITYVP
jgi:hypothetical protein